MADDPVTPPVPEDIARNPRPRPEGDDHAKVKALIMSEFAFLQKTCPGSTVFDVLSSATSFPDGDRDLL